MVLDRGRCYFLLIHEPFHDVVDEVDHDPNLDLIWDFGTSGSTGEFLVVFPNASSFPKISDELWTLV